MKETVYRITGVPKKLALLADFHNRPNPAIISSLQRHQPDLICIAGDVVYGREPLDSQTHVLPFLRDCASIAPTFLSLGNHEQSLSSRELREIKRTGVVFLDNSWREMDGLIIGGLTSAYVTDRRKGKQERTPETKWLDRFTAVPGYHILLAHHPEYWPEVKEKKIELMVCGHAHGGQIRLFNHGLFAPGQGWLPKYTKGVYDGRMVVSAGLSNTAGVPRLFNPTEIVYIEGAE